MGTWDWGTQADEGMDNGKLLIQIPNVQSPIPSPKSYFLRIVILCKLNE